MKMNKYIETNKKRWDELAEVHFKGDFYDVESFIRGGISISDLEIKEIGREIQGQKLLHLQCHFGKDSLSWVRLGAQVTGVDFSPIAIELAHKLSQQTGLKATFIEADINNLKSTPLEPNSFDIVFTSHGAIYWLPDLDVWAENISLFLKDGGIFYIADSHPMGMIFDERCEKGFQIRYPYFHSEIPISSEEEGSYADETVEITNKVEYGWVHNLGYIINCLIKVGLIIDFIHEFPFISWKQFPFLEQKQDDWWYIPEDMPQLPLMFTLRAIKN